MCKYVKTLAGFCLHVLMITSALQVKWGGGELKEEERNVATEGARKEKKKGVNMKNEEKQNKIRQESKPNTLYINYSIMFLCRLTQHTECVTLKLIYYHHYMFRPLFRSSSGAYNYLSDALLSCKPIYLYGSTFTMAVYLQYINIIY
jgi:hypothetical protein